MSNLQSIKKGKIKQNELIALLGGSGVGKSTMAADAPNPIFIDVEEGTGNLDVSRFSKPKSFSEVCSQMKELISSEHDYKTFCLDSTDHLEPLIWAEVCAENKVKEIGELAYGKGYALALEKWHEFINLCRKLREKMNVILIAHSQVKQVNDPMRALPYDRHEFKLNTKAAALIKESVDCVLFATFEMHVVADKSGQKGKAFGKGNRVLLTQAMPAHEGKNRFGLPYSIPLSWTSYIEAKEKGEPESPETLKKTILLQLENIADPVIKEKATKVFQEAGNNSTDLAKILNRIQVINNPS